MDMTTTARRLADQMDKLCRTLEEFGSATKAEQRAAVEAMYVPRMPHRIGLKGAAPLDGQLVGTASNAESAAYECDVAMEYYDSMAKHAAAILRSPILKSLGTMTEAGKAKVQSRRSECEKMRADAQTELARRQKAREEAMAELEKAQEVAKEVARIKQELATMRATFS